MPSNKRVTPLLNSPAANFGLNFAVGMAIFSFVGYKIDQKRGDGSAFTLIGMFLGLIYGGYEVWKLTHPVQPPPDEENT